MKDEGKYLACGADGSEAPSFVLLPSTFNLKQLGWVGSRGENPAAPNPS